MNVGELYVENKDALVRKLTVYSRDAHAAEDAVQQSYLKAMAQGSLTGMSTESAGAWLYVTARNALVDEKRKTLRWTVLTNDAEIALDEPDKDDMLLLNDLLAKLSEEQKEIVTLRYLTGLDSRTIGQMLNIPPATVRTRLRAALKKLHNELN